jgi:hypothetical protein
MHEPVLTEHIYLLQILHIMYNKCVRKKLFTNLLIIRRYVVWASDGVVKSACIVTK